jgi:2-polyprenyl-3-methyl-5-hydroxy-6-metoxy-1,4-benzoquinol methylase
MFARRRASNNGTSLVSQHADAADSAAADGKSKSRSSATRMKLAVGFMLVAVCLYMVSVKRTSKSLPPVAAPASQQQQEQQPKSDPWKFFNGDLNLFYNNLEKDIQRDANNIDNYAVHRWMGDKHSTYEHYYLMKSALQRYHPFPSTPKRMFDGGCGLGAGLMWFEREEPEWTLLGHTISETQYEWITTKIPSHKFHVELKSYDELDTQVDFIYSIEALLHSPNLTHTLEVWSHHLDDGGILCVIDDFLAIGTSFQDEEVQEFVKSWQAPSLVTPTQMVLICKKFGLVVREARDLNAEYQINEMHYKNELEAVTVSGDRTHQAWKGSKVRGRLMVTGKMTYHMMVFQKPFRTPKCHSVIKRKSKDEEWASFDQVTSENIGGISNDDGLLGMYSCGEGREWYDDGRKANGTESLLGGLGKETFGSYQQVFATRLHEFYETLPANTTGTFLNIATSSGVADEKVAGPLEYWTLLSDSESKSDNKSLVCNLDNCPAAQDCSFYVTASIGVLEHTKRPWQALDEIARMTKQGGLALHVIPFSYPHHENDGYRLSHLALTTLLEERGFTVLDAGYDICTKSKSLRRRDEPFDLVWLTYIVAKKK